jgi:hypothetical protein
LASVSARYTELAGTAKPELEAIFAAGDTPEVAALSGFEYRGYNQPRAAAVLGIRKFIKVFYLDKSQRPFGCNTPVARNGLHDDWLPRPNADHPKRYAFFLVEPASPAGPDPLQRAAVLLDYARGGNPPYQIARILRDYLVRVEPGSDDLLLGKAFFVVAGARLASSFFIIERYRPLADTPVSPGARTGGRG